MDKRIKVLGIMFAILIGVTIFGWLYEYGRVSNKCSEICIDAVGREIYEDERSPYRVAKMIEITGKTFEIESFIMGNTNCTCDFKQFSQEFHFGQNQTNNWTYVDRPTGPI